MKSLKVFISCSRGGTVLIVSMIFLAVFSTLALALAAFSANTVEVAANQHRINGALTSAHSGLEVLRYYLGNMTISGGVGPTQRIAAISTALQNELTSKSVSNIAASYDPTDQILTISSVLLDSAEGRNFNAVISQPDANYVQLDITGASGPVSRGLRVNMDFERIGNGVFNYGVASKGPLQMGGQAGFDGVNLSIEAGVYLEGDNVSGDALNLSGQATIAGDVSIANQYATHEVGSNCSVGGATGDDAEDHIYTGVDYVDFPIPDVDHFKPYATGSVLDDDTDFSSHSILDNVTIKAGSNPTFGGDVVIRGVLLIETPNVVNFEGKAVVSGIIIGDGSIDAESADNSITFSGQVVGNDVTILSGEEFEGIKKETGTFILAPGFSLEFSGQANHMSGVIAANGITFSGEAGGTVNGSIINYSENPMTISGQSELLFNRSGIEADPTGFVSDQTLEFNASTYSEGSF